MAWWRRPPSHNPAPKHEPESSSDNKDRKLDEALAEADAALTRAKMQKAQQKTVGEIIRGIREENHLANIWIHDGMGA